MDKQSGKLFLILSIIFCIFTIYGDLPSFDTDLLQFGYWFMTVGLLLTCLVDGILEYKKKRLLYAIGSLLITFALMVFIMIQLLS